MSITSAITDPLLNLHGTAAYLLVGASPFAEAAMLFGFVLPGETAVILGGVLAYRHSVSLTVMVAVVVIAAILGDSVGFEIGKRYGERVLTWRVLDRHRKALDAGKSRVLALGGRAVLLARFTAFLRAVMPGLAGTVRMPYRTFLAWNAAGGLIWGAGFTLLGYFAGASYTTIEGYAGNVSTALLVLIVIAAVAMVIRGRRRGRRNRPTAASSTENRKVTT